MAAEEIISHATDEAAKIIRGLTRLENHGEMAANTKGVGHPSGFPMTIIATKPAPGVSTSVPESGQIIDVAIDIGWMRLPLPLHLNHVNIWTLDDGDGWTVIDCGSNTAETRQLWEGAIAGPLASKPIHRIVATHGHIDHVGFAGPLSELLGGS